MIDHNLPYVEKTHNNIFTYDDLFEYSLNTTERLKKFFRTLLVSRDDTGEINYVYHNYKSYLHKQKNKNWKKNNYSFDKASMKPDEKTPKGIYFESVLFLAQLLKYKPNIPPNYVTSKERELIILGNNMQNGVLEIPLTIPKNQIRILAEVENNDHIIGLGYHSEEEKFVIENNIEDTGLEDYITTYPIRGY